MAKERYCSGRRRGVNGPETAGPIGGMKMPRKRETRSFDAAWRSLVIACQDGDRPGTDAVLRELAGLMAVALCGIDAGLATVDSLTAFGGRYPPDDRRKPANGPRRRDGGFGFLKGEGGDTMKSCRNCRWRPRSWTRFECIGGAVWFEGRCRQGRTTRPDAPGCRHWLPHRHSGTAGPGTPTKRDTASVAEY